MKKLLITLITTSLFYPSFCQEFSILHDGLTRTYRLHVPPDYNPDSLYPLVINMHGLGSNAFEQEVYTEFDNVADTAGLIVAYPNGIGEEWNISLPTGTDDVGFISALIDTLDSQYTIDLNRVFATGMSMGGFMSYRLACELYGRIAAIASVAGLQAFYPCNPDRPVPVLQIHGTLDPVVPYGGVPTTISNWVNHDLCPLTPTATNLPDIDTADNSTVTVYNYEPCEDSTEVMLYTINGGEHTWPGAPIIIGITNQDIKASNEIWNFFRKFTLQGSTGIESQASQQSDYFRVYPNPAHGLTTVELSKMAPVAYKFSIYDMAGKIVLERKNLTDSRFVMDFSQLTPGFYTAMVRTGQVSYFQKLIVR